MALLTRFLPLRAFVALVLAALSLASEASLNTQDLLARSPSARLGKTELVGSWRQSPDGDQLEFFGGE